MNFTLADFNRLFPDDDSCLEYIAQARFKGICPTCSNPLYRIRTRKCYGCSKGHQVSPTAGTLFNKSSTPLKSWLYAFYLMSVSKNGVAAQELQRHLGVTEKTAWRMANEIRGLMVQGTELLSGTVEMDEAYIGGRKRGLMGTLGKTPVLGIVERGGEIRTRVVEETMRKTLMDYLKETVALGSTVITDEYTGYLYVEKYGYIHKTINHSTKRYADGDIYTNTLEGFWSQVKRSLHGTFHSVSPKHLQSYLDYFSFQYNHRGNPFYSLVSRLWLGAKGQRISLVHS